MLYKISTHCFLFGCLLGAMVLSPHAMEVASTFGEGTDGWSVGEYNALTFEYFCQQGATFHSEGGNPGGYISVYDAGGWAWFFRAPAQFLGDVSWVYNGMLSFDRFDSGGEVLPMPNDVALFGSGMILVFDTEPPGNSWTHTEVCFLEAEGWYKHTGEEASGADMVAVLSNLDSLLIRAEHINGPETAGLDNVVMSGSFSAFVGDETLAPDPPTMLWALPRPFSSCIILQYTIPEPGRINLDIYDVSGRHISQLANDWRDAGLYEISWNKRNSCGGPVTPGVYFARLVTPGTRRSLSLIVSN